MITHYAIIQFSLDTAYKRKTKKFNLDKFDHFGKDFDLFCFNVFFNVVI